MPWDGTQVAEVKTDGSSVLTSKLPVVLMNLFFSQSGRQTAFSTLSLIGQAGGISTAGVWR